MHAGLISSYPPEKAVDGGYSSMETCSNEGEFPTCVFCMYIMYKSRFMNLKKLFPYIPDSLNNILLHFTKGVEIFYEHIDEVLEDLHQVSIQ